MKSHNPGMLLSIIKYTVNGPVLKIPNRYNSSLHEIFLQRSHEGKNHETLSADIFTAIYEPKLRFWSGLQHVCKQSVFMNLMAVVCQSVQKWLQAVQVSSNNHFMTKIGRPEVKGTTGSTFWWTVGCCNLQTVPGSKKFQCSHFSTTCFAWLHHPISALLWQKT